MAHLIVEDSHREGRLSFICSCGFAKESFQYDRNDHLTVKFHDSAVDAHFTEVGQT